MNNLANNRRSWWLGVAALLLVEGMSGSTFVRAQSNPESSPAADRQAPHSGRVGSSTSEGAVALRDSRALVTGSDAVLRDEVGDASALGVGATIRLVPVNPPPNAVP